MGDPAAGPAWRFRQVAGRLDAIDTVVADYAAAYYERPFRRSETVEAAATPPTVTWTIDKDLVAELVVDATGPARLLVHELGLLAPLRKRVRSGHLTITLAEPDPTP